MSLYEHKDIFIYIIFLDFRMFPNFQGPWTEPLTVYADERAKTLRLREAQMNFSSFFWIKWNITFKPFTWFIVGFIWLSSFTLARNNTCIIVIILLLEFKYLIRYSNSYLIFNVQLSSHEASDEVWIPKNT